MKHTTPAKLLLVRLREILSGWRHDHTRDKDTPEGWRDRLDRLNKLLPPATVAPPTSPAPPPPPCTCADAEGPLPPEWACDSCTEAASNRKAD